MDCDQDIQNELLAMTGASNASLFGATRMTNVQTRTEGRNGVITRQIFNIDNPASAQIQVSNNAFEKADAAPVLSASDRAAKIELEAILRKPAHTVDEKFQVLEARDKLIRLTTKRTTDITAVRTRGICPDMCPEKERMRREIQHRVAAYEAEDGSKSTMNHPTAVKEYSRSSADQESALSHELRPEPVLKLTMTYLLQNIMDLCDIEDTNICDWYHFLWDRTRGVRKDITQQELSSPGTVLLVEQCARFHIHCAARLVAEPPSVFDQKINNENLTKCLQSLKYMYHDLGLKMIRCPNEAEFRAYIVLMNLQNSNFLWEVKQLRDDIKHSAEIQFAIKIYLALESNNYVRFFQLVRSTTYMNACILLRYFTQVRVKALEIMFKAYVVRNPVQLSIEFVTYLLAFEDYVQCADFLEYYGLRCDRDNDRVTFDRSSFEYPDTPFLLDRALNVVEHKRHTSVGEAVHGCPLDSKDVLADYQPHDSFDDNGLLLPMAWSAEDQDYYKPEARIEARADRSPRILPRDDASVFKVPTALPRASVKQRLSPKTVETTPENAFGASNKLAANTTNTGQNNVFGASAKTTPATDTSIFNSFGGFKPTATNQPTSNPPKSLFASVTPAEPKPDETDSIFGRVSANNAGSASTNIFSSNFSQKTDTSQSLFSNQNLFTSNNTNASGSIFSGFGASSAESQEPKGLTFTPSAFTKPAATNLFGGATTTAPTQGLFSSQSARAEARSPDRDLFEDATIEQLERMQKELREMERKQRELEELEEKRKAEAAERERQKKLEAERIEEERKQNELKRKQIEESTIIISESITEEVLEEEVRKLLDSEVERHRKLEESMQNLYESIVADVISHEIGLIASDVKSAWEKNVLHRFFSGWQLYTRKRREQRRILSSTPLWMPSKPREQMLPELQHPLQARTLSLMKRYRSGLPIKLVVPPQREDSIDIWNIVSPALTKLRAKQRSKASAIYWKCVISIPDSGEDASYKTINEWLDNVFIRQSSKYPRQSDIFFAEQFVTDGLALNVCMRKFSGSRMLNEAQRQHTPKDVHGTNAVLFFLTSKNLHGARDRLKSVMQSVELSDACGIVIYSLSMNDAVQVKRVLRVDEFLNNENIDECFFGNGMNHRASASLCQLTKHSLRYVAQTSFYDDHLEMQQTVSLLRVCLSDELWQRIHLSISRNPTLRLAATKFTFLRDYYNEAIERLIALCTPDCSDSPPLFPHELRRFVSTQYLDIPRSLEYFPEDWHVNIERQQCQLTTFFNSLRIHGSIELDDITDIGMLEQRIYDFVLSQIRSPTDARRTAYKIIEKILTFLQSAESKQTDAFNTRLAAYNWLEAMQIFTVDLLSFRYQRICNQNQLADYIIYDRCEYQEYTKSPWWLQINEDLLKSITVQVKRNVDDAVDAYEMDCKRQRLEETLIEQDNEELERALARGYELLANTDKTLSEIKENRTTALDITKDFDVDLYRQEKHCRDTKDYLKSLNEN